MNGNSEYFPLRGPVPCLRISADPARSVKGSRGTAVRTLKTERSRGTDGEWPDPAANSAHVYQESGRQKNQNTLFNVFKEEKCLEARSPTATTAAVTDESTGKSFQPTRAPRGQEGLRVGTKQVGTGMCRKERASGISEVGKHEKLPLSSVIFLKPTKQTNKSMGCETRWQLCEGRGICLCVSHIALRPDARAGCREPGGALQSSTVRTCGGVRCASGPHGPCCLRTCITGP